MVIQTIVLTMLILLLRHQSYDVPSDDELSDTGLEEENVEEKGPKLPGIGVVGVKKCGTGALLEILRMHPSIVVPPYEGTEIQFWGIPHLMERGIQYYQVTENLH